MYTNHGLARHAKKALADKTKYMWGGIYRPITDSYVDMLAKMYPAQYTSARKQLLKALPDGYYGVDCVGLIKSYYWSGKANGGAGSPYYGKAGYPDVNAHGMYNAAKIKGKIGTLPEIEGIVLYCKSRPHVGVYIGGGEVIESTLGSRGDGVVKTKLKDFGWEYWCKCPYIEYFGEESEAFAVGDRVRIKADAATYAGTSIKIPQAYKGKAHTYTVMQVDGSRLLLREIYSWVRREDVER